MEDYAERILGVDEIRAGAMMDELGLLENKVYRKFVGKLSWLAENCRPDLSVVALNMAQKCKSATLGDLMMINKVLKKIWMKKNEVFFSRIGRKEDLVVTGVGDASYKLEKSIGGNIDLLRNDKTKTDKVLPLFWVRE